MCRRRDGIRTCIPAHSRMVPMVDRKSHPNTNSSMTPGSTSNARSTCLFPSLICTSICSVTPLDRPSANRTCLCVAPSSKSFLNQRHRQFLANKTARCSSVDCS
ncbi:hypothetical protein ACLKA7_000851 [Drosophila subpalustris]